MKIFVLIGLIFFPYKDVEASKRVSCSWREYCVPLDECPYLEKKLERLKQQNRRKEFREFICDFRDGRILVCCPKLPKRCGVAPGYDKIIGGKDVKTGAFPWMAALRFKRSGIVDEGFHCCGSLINSRYVLTAAHCLEVIKTGDKLEAIHLGETDLSVNPECINGVCYNNIVAGYEKLILHPEFSSYGFQNDVALIRLNASIHFNDPKVRVRPLCLATYQLNLKSTAARNPLTVAGWGFTEKNTTTNLLKSTTVPLVDDNWCSKIYGRKYDMEGRTQICAGGEKGSDTCRGDSGGPLLFNKFNGPRYVQVGIVSFGPTPCGINIPAVYTSVPKYRQWIIQQLEP